ncbi:hypothetical protein ACS0PU_010676 [Formica fusca]
MRVCTTLIPLRPRNFHRCFRTTPCGERSANASRSYETVSKVSTNSIPRTKNNSEIEFQGNVIAIILFATSRRRHGHYFSNYDVSRLPCNPDRHRRRWKTAMR